MYEQLTMDGYASYRLSTTVNSTVEVGTNYLGRTTFTSTVAGIGKDNPQDPDALANDPVALSRSVTFSFENTACFSPTFAIIPIGQDAPSDPPTSSNGGRNFLFAGQGIVESNCIRYPFPRPPP